MNQSVISLKDYQVFAGPSWPTYQDILNGQMSDNPVIAVEIQEFKRMMQENYNALHRSSNDLSQDNQTRQKQIFFDKKYQGTRRCQVPWNTLGINANGNAFICQSPSWIPKFVGNILECNNIYDILNSNLSISIRQEIVANRYLYCNNKICSFFSNVPVAEYSATGSEDYPLEIIDEPELRVTSIPTNLIFDFDYTCNFRCPSCRTDLINHNKHPVVRPTNNMIVKKIKQLIIDSIDQQPINIRWCGGEPFISEPYLDLMNYINSANKANIKHIIQTNGSYLQSKKDIVTQLMPNVQEFRISFDAATEATYNKIRVNGVWETLLNNVQWLVQQVKDSDSDAKISADFVVQLSNYAEIPAFVDLCKKLEITRINWQKMWNWGTWPSNHFDQHNVYNSDHPEYQQLVTAFRNAGQPMSLI